MDRSETAFQQITKNVWVYPCGKPDRIEPVVGAIVTESQTILIDAGNGPAHARAIQRSLDSMGAPPVSTVIYTHHHWDHTFGCCVFDAEVIAHETCRARMKEAATIPWGPEYLLREMRENPRLERSNRAKLMAVDNWEEWRLVLPDRVFSTAMSIHVEGITLELQHVSGRHAEDSITVKVAEQGVLFLGDCFYPPPIHLRKPDDKPSWDMLLQVGDESVDWYIHGHGEPLTRERVMRFVAQNSALS